MCICDVKEVRFSIELKATVIVPADTRQIEKYRYTNGCMIEETPHDYEIITLPYLREHKLKANDLKVRCCGNLRCFFVKNVVIWSLFSGFITVSTARPRANVLPMLIMT